MINSKQSPSVTPNSKAVATKQAEAGTCADAACSANAFVGWGFLFSVIYCVIVAVATAYHWPNSTNQTGYETSTLCALPPLQDVNNSAKAPPDYPNPRCPDASRFDEDKGAMWYYWRSKDFVWYSQVTAWLFYAAHQFAHWGIILYAQALLSSDKQRKVATDATTTNPPAAVANEPKYSTRLRPFNWWSFGVNGFFCILHLLQTHFMGYDALAPSVHEMASQGSVIIMLVMIVMMETDRRGMFFGQPISLFREAADVVKRYHGYVFSWAAIFTFWYHPMYVARCFYVSCLGERACGCGAL
jgi:hypothetical protein